MANDIEHRGLMPHQPGHGWPHSRDWGRDDFDCKATNCVCNIGGKCLLPSQAEIGEDGRCTGYRQKPPDVKKHGPQV